MSTTKCKKAHAHPFSGESLPWIVYWPAGLAVLQSKISASLFLITASSGPAHMALPETRLGNEAVPELRIFDCYAPA
jgi:hypothetical protein